MKKLLSIVSFVLVGCSAAPKVQKNPTRNPMRIYESSQEFLQQFPGESACNGLGSSCSANAVLYGCPVRVEALIFGEGSHTDAWSSMNSAHLTSEQLDSCFDKARADFTAKHSEEEANAKYWLTHISGAYWVAGLIQREQQQGKTIGINIRLENKELTPEQQLQYKD